MMGSGGVSVTLLGVRGGFLMEVNCLTGFQAEISRRLVDVSACFPPGDLGCRERGRGPTA